MKRSPKAPRKNVEPNNSTAELEEKLRDAAKADETHRHTEALLRDEWAYAESIVDTVREPMLVLDGKLRVKTASRAFYSNFGVSREATEGRFLYDLGNGQWNIPKLRTLLEEVLPLEKILQDFEIVHDFPILGRRVMLLNARTLWRADTERILLAIEDITERKRIEDELLRSNEDLQRFAYSAAHDLRSPLDGALNLAQLLRRHLKGRIDSEGSQMLTLAIENMERLGALMRDLLNYSEMGNAPQRYTLVSLEESLKIALANLRHHIERQGAVITVGALPNVFADRTQVALVFQNIIGNAIKYRSKQAPRISVEGVEEGKDCRLSISDNGQGFKPEYSVQIFEPFKRLHARNIPGSGIGLATCKRMIERMGGRIWAESTPGEGSTFHFTLPIKQNE